jgi:riboflavin kinase/FMN adenylyltransferase
MIRVFKGLGTTQQPPCFVAIGNFDGVHVGHQSILRKMVQQAHHEGLDAVVISFYPHPRYALSGEHTPLLDTLRERVFQLSTLGIDRVHLIKFNQKFAKQSAEDFLTTLLTRISMRSLWVGEDFAFGYQRQGNINWLKKQSQEKSFALQITSDVLITSDQTQKISSTIIRNRLAEQTQGEMNAIQALLGHPFVITNRVCHGLKLGRTLGFPTLNLHPPVDCPARGIYVVTVQYQTNAGDLSPSYPAVASLGKRPTLNRQLDLLLEVHVLDWTQTVYGKIARVTFLHKIRNEEQFDSLSELQQAIDHDVLLTRQWFAQYSPTNFD